MTAYISTFSTCALKLSIGNTKKLNLKSFCNEYKPTRPFPWGHTQQLLIILLCLHVSQALDVQWINCRVNVKKKQCHFYNKEKSSNAFFGTNVNKSVYFFVYGFRLTFAVFMDGDLPNSCSAASFIREQTIILR